MIVIAFILDQIFYLKIDLLYFDVQLSECEKKGELLVILNLNVIDLYSLAF